MNTAGSQRTISAVTGDPDGESEREMTAPAPALAGVFILERGDGIWER
ncbi:chaperone DnaK [Desmospora sp. 8437]|nr:chaperone DnaK [Desmospora sp. 8437]